MNLPINISEERILIASIGGGYDIYGAFLVMLLLEKDNLLLQDRKILFNYTSIAESFEGEIPYIFPEQGFISYKTNKIGVVPLRKTYETIIKKHNIQRIVTVDCGVDSLMTGEEEKAGSFIDEFINFAALKQFDLPHTHICIGMTCEIEEELNHYWALNNMQELVHQGAFLGSCSLLKKNRAFHTYKEYYETAHYNAKIKSHIHPRIINAVMGFDFIKEEPNSTILKSTSREIFYNPFMPILWFFDGKAIIKNNPYLDQIKDHINFTQTFMELDIEKTKKYKALPIL